MQQPPNKTGKATPERKQGKTGGSGVNKPVEKHKVAQVDAKVRYGKPTQTQKM